MDWRGISLSVCLYVRPHAYKIDLMPFNWALGWKLLPLDRWKRANIVAVGPVWISVQEVG